MVSEPYKKTSIKNKIRLHTRLKRINEGNFTCAPLQYKSNA